MGKRGYKARPAIERLLERVEIDPGTGCWNALFSKVRGGYSRIAIYPKTEVYVHRLAYEHFRGSIPEKLDVHHICRNPKCVNPDHLELLTRYEHTHRSLYSNAAKMFCRNGHRLSLDNVYQRPSTGYRECRICRKLRKKKYGDFLARSLGKTKKHD